MKMNSIEALTQILRESKNVVFFGGAGAARYSESCRHAEY